MKPDLSAPKPASPAGFTIRAAASANTQQFFLASMVGIDSQSGAACAFGKATSLLMTFRDEEPVDNKPATTYKLSLTNTVR